MVGKAFKWPVARLFFLQLIRAYDKKNIEAPHYWPFYNENSPVTDLFTTKRSRMLKAFPSHDVILW